MFCENCGKSLIRGYQFCLECGTPVPPEAPEEEPVQQEPESEGMPGIKPIGNSEDGKLVFCQNCGMRMQQTSAFCEQCGMQLQSNANSGNGYSNLPSNNGVPLWNTEQIDYGYENITDGELQQINNFMSGGGIEDPTQFAQPEQDESFGGMDAIGGGINAGGLDVFNSQYANLCKSDNDNAMPAIGNQAQMINDEVRKVENFAMDASYVDNTYVDEGSLPVIEGASMDFDPDEPEPEDPNAFVMTPEAIEDITPKYTADDDAATEFYTEPTVAYEEPVAEPEVPVYNEPAVAYEEPVAEPEVPVYNEPAVVTEEPVAEPEIPVYDEPAVANVEPAAPAFTIPVYSEDAAAPQESVYASQQEPAYSEDIPLYSDPNETAVPVYNEPTPVYEEPTTAHESAVQPVAAVPEYTDTSSEVTSLFSEQSGSDDETLLMAQQNEVAPDPIAEAPATYATSNADIQNQYVPESESTVIFNDDTLIAANQESAPESNNIADLGKLVYCRNCGQDMYEKAQKCDMCGHPNIWWGPDAKRTLTHKVSGAGSTDQKPAKEKFKLFGIFSVPALVCICLGIAFLAFLIVPSILGGKEEIKTNKDKTQTVEVDNGGGSNDEQTEQAEQSDSTTTSTTASESVATTTTTDPVEAETTEASDDNGAQQTAEADTEQTTANTTATTPATTTTTAATTTTATTTTATTTTKPNTTTTVATTTATQPSYYAPSATVKSQNKERDAIISAYETMAAEIGKMQLLVSTIEYEAIKRGNDIEAAGKSLYSYGIGADILKSIKNGKSGVTSAVTSAKPTTSELNAAYKSLQTLQSKYNAYYDYIVGATKFSNYVSKCSSYFNDFQSTASSSLALSKLNTSAQNTTDRDHYYADVLSEAFSAVDNAVSAYTTLYNKGKAVSSSAFDSEFPSMLASNASTYIKAAKYAQAVSSYCDILKSAPSAYSSAYKQLQKASEHLNNCTDLFVGAALDQSLESFKSNANTYINGASSASNTGKSYL